MCAIIFVFVGWSCILCTVEFTSWMSCPTPVFRTVCIDVGWCYLPLYAIQSCNMTSYHICQPGPLHARWPLMNCPSGADFSNLEIQYAAMSNTRSTHLYHTLIYDLRSRRLCNGNDTMHFVLHMRHHMRNIYMWRTPASPLRSMHACTHTAHAHTHTPYEYTCIS